MIAVSQGTVPDSEIVWHHVTSNHVPPFATCMDATFSEYVDALQGKGYGVSRLRTLRHERAVEIRITEFPPMRNGVAQDMPRFR